MSERTTFPETVSSDALAARLRRHGVSPTPQRLEIARLLFARPQHLSADRLLAMLSEGSGQPVSKATVYNTLNLFARKGLVREVIADPSRIFYDSNTSAHHHLFDVETGTLTDIEPGDIDVAAPRGVPDGVEVAGIDVVVRVRRRRT